MTTTRRLTGSSVMLPSTSSNSTLMGGNPFASATTTTMLTTAAGGGPGSSLGPGPGPGMGAGASTSIYHRQALLRQLVLSSLLHSPLTALFFAERLHALDSSYEPSVYLLALVLSQNNRHHEAIWLLRQPVTFHPNEHLQLQQQQQPQSHNHQYDPSNPFNVGSNGQHQLYGAQTGATAPGAGSKRWSANTRLTRPTIECSLRCARLYAHTCSLVQRHKEARDVLAKILSTSQPLIQPDHATELPLLAASSSSIIEPYVLDLELARLARQSGEHERAIQAFRKALDKNPWCWEALEGLCAEGAPPDPDVLYPPRPRAPVSVPISPLPSSTTISTSTMTAVSSRPPLATHPSHPPPLGPSQSSTVNSAFSFNGKGLSARAETMGFFTPSDTASPLVLGGGAKGKEAKTGGGLFGLGGGAAAVSSIWRKTRGADISELSMEDSSFDTSFYPQPLNLQNNAHPSTSNPTLNSLFTPPTTVNLTTGAVPGVKRTRGGVQAPAAMTTPTGDEEMKPMTTATAAPSKRVVRGVPAGTAAAETGSKHRRDGSIGAAPAATRRSSRLSRDTGSSNGISAGSVSMALTRSQLSANGGGAATTRSASARDKKRSKAGAGPSVLSDAGSDALSPPSMRSSSPAPSSPGATHPQPSMQQALTVDPGVQEAEDYVAHLLRCFGSAATNAAKYECAKSIEALLALPAEQQRTWRCLVGIGKAHLELLNYEKAEKAFSQARQLAPHLLDSMELYSTLLWHLRLSTSLSFLAQDLMLIAPRSPSAWIASGNVFSHLEDHGSALQCFKRAAQHDPSCVYAYTLSGHECVVLEEWERALGFFREAIRRDRRHYNAWFGIGNVYLQTGKYRLAEFHFRHAATINPTNATLRCCVGSVLEKLGRRKDALEVYERACALAPDSAAVRFKRTRILLHLKRYDQAEIDLLLLKDRAPNEFNVHFLLGKLYKIVGRKTDMLRHFGLAQDLEPRTASLIREQVERDAAITAREMEVDEV